MTGRPVRLSRNRDYTILWTGQLSSELAIELVLVAVPLLVLFRTGSAVQAGLAGTVMALAAVVSSVPAGVVADRWDRRKVLLWCQAGRVAAHAVLVAVLVGGAYVLPVVLAVVAVEGVLGSVFDPTEHAALPLVVPESQLTAAVAVNAARPYLATLVGPALAGVLFAVHPVAPFAAVLGVLALSAAALPLLRLPRTPPVRDPADRGGIGAGARWVLGTPLIRTALVWQMLTNLVFNAVVVVVLVVSHEDDAGPGELGLTMACLGVGGVLGALLATRARAVAGARAVVLGFAWLVAVAVFSMAFVPTGLPLGLLLGLAALLAPVANTAVLTHQLVTTPDALRGRMSAICGFGTGGAAAIGPVAGGALAATGGTAALLVCAGVLTIIAIGATASRTLRRFTDGPISPQGKAGGTRGHGTADSDTWGRSKRL